MMSVTKVNKTLSEIVIWNRHEEEPEGAVQVHVRDIHVDEQAGQVPNEPQVVFAEVHLPAHDEDLLVEDAAE